MFLCYNTLHIPICRKNEGIIVGYREFAKDYQIEYREVPGKKHPEAVRVYVGPWYRFAAPPERIRFLRWFYLIGLVLISVSLLATMLIDCAFTRIWYIQVPGVAIVLPWIFAACATWRLWTAGEKMTREHDRFTGNRMSGATLFLMGLSFVSCFACCRQLVTATPAAGDYAVCACYLICFFASTAMFSRRKELATVLVEQN